MFTDKHEAQDHARDPVSRQLVEERGCQGVPPGARSPFREVPASAFSDPVFGLVGGWCATEHLRADTVCKNMAPSLTELPCVLGGPLGEGMWKTHSSRQSLT